MSKKFISIFIITSFISTIMLSFTNCTPIHESGGSAELLSLNECEENFKLFYQQNILKFENIGASFTCGECHSSGGSDGPQFLDSFSVFAGMANGQASIKDKVNSSTTTLLRNATDGFSYDLWDHAGGDITASDPVSASSVRSALTAANEAYEACELNSEDSP